MVRGKAAKGISKKFAGEVRTRKGGLGALLGVVLAGTGFLSGCAGLANTSNANLTPQEVQITPALLTFPNVSVGQLATQVATLTNTGSKSVSITQLSVSSNEFTATGIATPLTLGPGQSTQFKVSFKSSTAGTISGTLSAMTSRGGGSTKVKLNGNAGKTSSQLSLSTTSLKYGNVLVHGSSTQAVTLKNSGSSDVNISQLSVSGAGFSVSGVAVPFTLPAGQSAALQATFAPAAAGAATGSVTIASDAQTTSSSVALSGTGVNATYTMLLNPTSVTFGNLNVGSSATQTVQLSNTGNASFTVTQVSAAGVGVSVSGLPVPTTIAPSQSVPLTVTFAPPGAGSYAGSLSVVSNATNSPATVSLSGKGVQPAISAIPSVVAFTNVSVGVTNTQTVNLTNLGTANLTVSQASLVGAGFSYSGLSLPLTILPGGSSTFTVGFKPSSASSFLASLSLISNAPTSPLTVSLSGTGVFPSLTISASPTTLSFGTVSTGSIATQNVTLTNTGNSAVSISQVSVAGSSFSATGITVPLSLAAGQSTSFSVIFAPTTTGSLSGTITSLSNASNSPTTIKVSGLGASSAPHPVSLSWTPSTITYVSFNIFRSSISGGPYAQINSSLTPSYADTSVTSGQTYYYVVTEVDSSGAESTYSNEAAAPIP